MKHIKMVLLGAAAALLLVAAYSATAQATVLCKNGTSTAACTASYGVGTILGAKLTSRSIIETTKGAELFSCEGGALKANVTTASGEPVLASVTELAFSGCSTETVVISGGSLKLASIAGSDNGTLTSVGAEVKFNYLGISCTYGTATGTSLGVINGGKGATLAISAILKKSAGPGECPGEARWTSSWKFEEPESLFVAAGPVVPAVLCNNGTSTTTCTEPHAVGTVLSAKQTATSTLESDYTEETVLSTCTGGALKASVTSAGSKTAPVTAYISEFTQTGCTGAATVVKPGEITVEHTAGTDNGKLTLIGTEITYSILSTTCTYGAGTGTDLGTLTGAKGATLVTEVILKKTAGSILCPVTPRWKASWKFEGPENLFVAAEAKPVEPSTLCKNGTTTTACTEPYGLGTMLSAKQTAKSVFETTGGAELINCKGGTLNASVTNAGGESSPVSASISKLSFTECSNTVTVFKAGEFTVEHVAGTDNGTLTLKGTEVTVFILGVTCTYGAGTGTDLGNLIGAKGATISVSAIVKKTAGGFLCPPEARWTSSWKFEEPESLFVAGA